MEERVHGTRVRNSRYDTQFCLAMFRNGAESAMQLEYLWY
jgi:hypothetical protein